MKKHLLTPKPLKKEIPIEFYESLGDSITEREIVTDSAERDSIKMKTAEYMHSHLGEEFTGTITDVIPIGFFVELDSIYVEGLVHVSSLQNDFYELDRNGVALVGRNRGGRFMAGDRVKVVVSAADKERGRVDFGLLGVIGKRQVKITPETASKNKKSEKKTGRRTAAGKKPSGYGRPGRRKR
jgi:ribonuclease R